jgi:hypothetical protein
MGKYVLAFKGGGVPETEEESQQVMAAWTSWFGSLGESVVDAGNPFGPSASIAGDGSVGGSAESGLTGYSIVSADSLDDALGKAKGCPILSSGGSIEVYETFDLM